MNTPFDFAQGDNTNVRITNSSVYTLGSDAIIIFAVYVEVPCTKYSEKQDRYHSCAGINYRIHGLACKQSGDPV